MILRKSIAAFALRLCFDETGLQEKSYIQMQKNKSEPLAVFHGKGGTDVLVNTAGTVELDMWKFAATSRALLDEWILHFQMTLRTRPDFRLKRLAYVSFSGCENRIHTGPG